MNVNVCCQHVTLPSNAGTRLADRARIVLARFRDDIARLDMTLKDINGPRGGKDKVCVVRAEMIDGRQIIIIDRNTSMRRAIGRALQRAKALITREFSRRRRDKRSLRQLHGTQPANLDNWAA